jgi:type IV pilus assembly protein PilP
MIRARSASIPLLSIACVTAIMVACGSSTAPPPPPAGAPPKPVARAGASASGSASATPALVFSEAEFQESDSNRDPFHNYAKNFLPTSETKMMPQYTVILEKYAVDELKLVAIVSASDGPRAMFVDPQGKGWVVQRGAHIGRGETVKLGPGVMSSYPLYWKIDRIKPTEVVLVREDSLHPEVQPTYREVPLHTEAEKT